MPPRAILWVTPRERQRKPGIPRLKDMGGRRKKLMEQMVPWVPYLWGDNITITAPSVTNYGCR
jgi:hypothetical protein